MTDVHRVERNNEGLTAIDAAILGAVFVLSRAAYVAHGLVFDDTTLSVYWQYLPIPVLRDDLLRGLIALHSQPPLFNLFLGIGLKSPAPGLFYEAAFKLSTFSLVLAMFYVMRGLAVPRMWALIAATLFLINPTLVLYEHWLFYTLPEATLVMLAAAALVRWEKDQSNDGAVAFAACASALVGLRSAYHPLWVILVLVALVWARRRRGRVLSRREAAILSAPIMVAAVLLAKNVWLIHQATTSSWTGMNLSRIAFYDVDPVRIAALVAQRSLSPLSQIGGFQVPDAYEPFAATFQPAVPRSPMAEHTALSQSYKPISHGINFNNLKYVGIGKILMQDSLTFIRMDPKHYAHNVLAAIHIFDQPASDNVLLEPNLSLLPAAVRLERRIVYPRGAPVFLWIAIAGILGAATRSGGREAEGLLSGVSSASVFAGITVLWFVVVANMVEYGENNRFRVAIDPLLYVSFIVAFSRGLAALTRRRV